MKFVFFISLLLTAINTSAALAHLFELPNKMALNSQDYLTVQQIYRGWSLLGFVVFGALLFNLVLAILLRGHRLAFPLALTGFLGVAAANAIFWIFTFPVNRQTNNWTILPDTWVQLRRQWEYSHAAGAAFSFLALSALILAALAWNK